MEGGSGGRKGGDAVGMIELFSPLPLMMFHFIDKSGATNTKSFE